MYKNKRQVTKIIKNMEDDLKEVLEAANMVNARASLLFGKLEKLKQQNETKRKTDQGV